MSEPSNAAGADRSAPERSERPYTTIQLRLVVEAEAFEDALRFYRDGLGLE
jgi:hypothetical protein